MRQVVLGLLVLAGMAEAAVPPECAIKPGYILGGLGGKVPKDLVLNCDKDLMQLNGEGFVDTGWMGGFGEAYWVRDGAKDSGALADMLDQAFAKHGFYYDDELTRSMGDPKFTYLVSKDRKWNIAVHFEIVGKRAKIVFFRGLM